MKRSGLRRGGPLRRMTEMKRGGALARRTSVKVVSDKRVEENKQRRVVLANLRVRIGCCQLRVIPECTRQPDDGHEILTRGRGGSITDPENILLACRPCHTFVTEHPAFSDEHGFTVHEWYATPEGIKDATTRRHLFHWFSDLDGS